ncbi:hypothetical protein CEP52_012842 [Fusarium oligoseptatum]|uniref:Uncharacterized protein n=3 Tax=Fusarium solani species complex TaxID=232080 RepID=A0A428SWE1_9HYPO|nr:hypothetical protein CEP51_004298 [Fusarium floridanum]RSL88191.1 hypothetical protein CDV31_016112 [Fusarium ambrosium]RSL94129.1 hypothetical protein CEP52_012842 [Fusarium oligoseptatum]
MTKKRTFTRSHHLSEENLKHNNKVEDERLKRSAKSEEQLRLGRLNLSCDDFKRGDKPDKVAKADKAKTPKSSKKKKTKDETPQSTVDALAAGGQHNLVPQGMQPLPYVSMVPPYHQAYAYPGASMGAQMMQQQAMMNPMMQAQMANAQAMHSHLVASQMMSTHMAHPQLMPQMMPQGMTPGFAYMPAAYPQHSQYQNAYAANMMYAGNQAYAFVPVESPTRQADVAEQEDIYDDDEVEESEEEASEEQTEEGTSASGYEDSASSD